MLAAVRFAGVRLPAKPWLAPWIVRVHLGDGRVQLRAPGFVQTLNHPLFIQALDAVGPLLDGQHELEEIAGAGLPAIEPTTVIFLLQQLYMHGVLHEGELPATPAGFDPSQWEAHIRFLGHLTSNPVAAQAALARAHVLLCGTGALVVAMEAALRSTGIGRLTVTDELIVDSDLEAVDLLVVGADSTDDSVFAHANEICLQQGRRWLRVAVDGTTAMLGPTVVPFQTACYRCYQLRVDSHLQDRQEMAVYRAHIVENGVPDGGSFAPFWSAVAAQASLEVARILGGFAPPATMGCFFELSALSPESTRHDVLRVPRCPGCGRERAPREAWSRASSSSSPQ